MADVDRLFAVPLDEFVEERKRLARELRAAGDKEAAAEVAKLPKPTPPAWALNTLARSGSADLAAWLEAAEELRAVSAGGGAGLRDAMAAHREATRALMAAVRDEARPGGKPLSAPMVERVRALLQAATVDAEQAEALRAGRMVEGDEGPGLFGLDGADSSGAEGAGEQRSKGTTEDGAARRDEAAASAAVDERAEREREAERKRAERVAQLEGHIADAEERVGGLREAAVTCDEAVAEADSRLEEARRTLHRSESEAEAAHAAADEAAAALASAERELRQLARQLRNVSGAG